MQEQHYQTDLVDDGADGLDYAPSGQYDLMDLVILDVMLPRLDGFEVARRPAQPISTPHSDADCPDETQQQDHRSGLWSGRLR